MNFNELYEKVKRNAESPPYLIYVGLAMIVVNLIFIGIIIGGWK